MVTPFYIYSQKNKKNKFALKGCYPCYPVTFVSMYIIIKGFSVTFLGNTSVLKVLPYIPSQIIP